MERKSFLVVAVIVETIALVLVSAGLVLVRNSASISPATPESRLDLRVLSLSENSTDGYERSAGANWTFLTLRVEVRNELSSEIFVDNGSLSISSGSVEYDGELAPPGPTSIGAGARGDMWVAFEVPRGIHIEKLALTSGGVSAEMAFSYSVPSNPPPPPPSPPPPTMGLSISQAGLNWSVVVTQASPGLLPGTTYIIIHEAQGGYALPKTAWSELTLANWDTNKALYQDANPSASDIRPGDGLLLDRATYPTGYVLSVLTDTDVINQRMLQ